MEETASRFDAEKMTRALLWLFFLADLAGIVWAVRVLVKEARRHLEWHVGQWRERRASQAVAIELPADVAVVTTVGALPRQRTADSTGTARPAPPVPAPPS